jgi:DNA polymerase-4
MVDLVLPVELRDCPLRYLFLDLNSFFASVEQQEQPEMRGRPIAVVPVLADTTFVIAASYPAKAFGVKCGTLVRDAKKLCPELQIVQARPPVYVAYHGRVLDAVGTVLPIDQVCSIDEMRFRLIGEERTPATVGEIAKRLKRAVSEKVGVCLTSSIGVAPNGFLAKVATEMQKPDGLVILEKSNLPQSLFGLKLTDFPGVNNKMAARLGAAGIFISQQLCEADRSTLARAFGSVVGERWWFMLRGLDVEPAAHSRKSLGHSHVLAPEHRTEDGCRKMLLRLIQKAAARLRANGLRACAMTLAVKGMGRSWEARLRMDATQDSTLLTKLFNEIWPSRDFAGPLRVAVTFFDLKSCGGYTPSLFDERQDGTRLCEAVDSVNRKFGKNSVYLAGLEGFQNRASEKIAFNKTWLFQEGKGDNVWTLDEDRP